MEYDEVCLNYFLEHQSQLFDENVADSLEEAEAFLEDCMAVICDSIKEVKQFLDESGADVSGMSNHEIEEAEEVFTARWQISGGRSVNERGIKYEQ